MMDITSLKYFAACQAGTGGGLNLGLPTWYKYLDCDATGTPIINSIYDIWEIVWALIELILFVGSVAAVFFLIYGGIQYITSQGTPDKTTQARKTITYAIVGLLIAMISRVVVQFIAGEFNADVGV
jgi:SNF2 family DNA or RNA helicase